jgi:hypothetical protein
MKIKVLGTRGEIKASLPEHANHSGVLIDDVILLDIGEKQFLNCHPKYIFITHLHQKLWRIVTAQIVTLCNLGYNRAGGKF